MLKTQDTPVGAQGDAIELDPEVRQARRVAEVARRRLEAVVASVDGGVDVAEAQRLLDTVRDATAYAEGAEDRVLQHQGLLTPAEVARRVEGRRAVPAEPAGSAGSVHAARSARRTTQGSLARCASALLVLMVIGLGAALSARLAARLLGGGPGGSFAGRPPALRRQRARW